uniref:Uncharacterized protein n=1 Tax=Anguilla anguilla TaxID=7936 RepID=A0A0E9WLQ6_ANGAN
MQGMYTRLPSTTSMRSSAVQSPRRVMSALWILYSARMLFTVSPSSSVWAHVAVKLMPPLSFFLKPMLGGFLLSRMPKPSSSCSISFL